MCVIMVIPKGTTLTKAEIKNAWQANPDGAGFAYACDGEIRMVHELSYARFSSRLWQAFYRHAEDSDFLVHCRIATHGSVCLANCHPFAVGSDGRIVVAHNGILRCSPAKGDDRSDTRVFVDSFLSRLSGAWERDPVCVAVIERYLGASMLATLDADGESTIFNYELGEPLDDGRWFSNSSPLGYRWIDVDEDYWGLERSVRVYECPVCNFQCGEQFWDDEAQACSMCVAMISNAVSLPQRSLVAVGSDDYAF